MYEIQKAYEMLVNERNPSEKHNLQNQKIYRTLLISESAKT